MASGHGRVGQLYDLHAATIHLECVGERRRRCPSCSIRSAWETIRVSTAVCCMILRDYPMYFTSKWCKRVVAVSLP